MDVRERALSARRQLYRVAYKYGYACHNRSVFFFDYDGLVKEFPDDYRSFTRRARAIVMRSKTLTKVFRFLENCLNGHPGVGNKLEPAATDLESFDGCRTGKPSGRAPLGLSIIFLGADAIWHEALVAAEMRRRHLYLLDGFIRSSDVSVVYVVQLVSRREFLLRILQPSVGHTGKAKPVFIASLFPRSVPMLDRLNRLLYEIQVSAQSRDITGERVVWAYALKGIKLYDRIRVKGSLFVDTDHDLIEDPNVIGMTRADRVKLLLRVAEHTAATFSGSRNMLCWYREHRIEDVVRLRNGVTPQRFSHSRRGQSFPEHPCLGHVGVLSPWIDYDFLLGLAQSRPHWRIRLAGNWYRTDPVERIIHQENMDLVGALPCSEVPSFLGTLDVAICFYRAERWLDGDSMKIFEYLAAGIPVVSTSFHPHLEDDFEGLVIQAANVEEFIEKVEMVLSWSVKEYREWLGRSEAFARKNTWDIRVSEALATIRKSLPGATPQQRIVGFTPHADGRPDAATAAASP